VCFKNHRREHNNLECDARQQGQHHPCTDDKEVQLRCRGIRTVFQRSRPFHGHDFGECERVDDAAEEQNDDVIHICQQALVNLKYCKLKKGPKKYKIIRLIPIS